MIEKNEFNQRLNEVIKILEKKNLKAVLIYCDEANSSNGWYLSGWSPQWESSFILITIDGYICILTGRETELWAKEDSNIKRTKISSIFLNPIIEYLNETMFNIKEIFCEALNNKEVKKVGIVGMNSIPLGIFNNLINELKGIELVDLSLQYENLRIIKSEYEIGFIKKAFNIADQGFKEIKNNIKEGITETFLDPFSNSINSGCKSPV